MSSIKSKYSNKFLIYEDYNNKLKSIDECIKLFIEIDILRGLFLKNEEEYKKEVRKFNINQQKIFNKIKNIEKTDDFWKKICNCISLIKNLGILFKNQKIYNFVDVKMKQDFFYLNLLDHINSYRHIKNDTNPYINKFDKYNLILYKKICNLDENEYINKISIDLKNDIYIKIIIYGIY